MRINRSYLRDLICEMLIESHEPVDTGHSAGELMVRARENLPTDVLSQAGYDVPDVSQPLAGGDKAVESMKKFFQSQMRHRVRQFLDFGQSEEKIIQAATLAAQELIDEISGK